MVVKSLEQGLLNNSATFFTESHSCTTPNPWPVEVIDFMLMLSFFKAVVTALSLVLVTRCVSEECDFVKQPCVGRMPPLSQSWHDGHLLRHADLPILLQKSVFNNPTNEGPVVERAD